MYARSLEEAYDDYEKGRKEADNRLREELERSKLKAELERTLLENEKLKADLEHTKLENALLTAQLSKSNNID